MDQKGKPLAAAETGTYAELAGRPLPPGLVLLFMPSLAALLTHTQDQLGQALTREQVLALRDRAAVMVSEEGPARAVEQQRGYADLNPADPWPDWVSLQEQAA